MRLPALTKWSAGDQPDASVFNEITYAIDFMNSPPAGWVVAAAAQSIPLTTWTSLTFDTAVEDREADLNPATPMWSNANPTRLYARTPGWYDIELFVSWPNTGTGTQRLQRLLPSPLLGTAVARMDQINVNALKTRNVYSMFLNAGDYVEAQVYTGTASSTATTAANNSERTGLRMKWFSL